MKLALASLLASSASAFGPSTSPPSAHARKPLRGFWKLNPQTKEEALTFASGIASAITDSTPDVDVALFVPYVFIESTMSVVGGKLSVGAEGVVPHSSGAYTGGISTSMIKSVGVDWVLAGHSERREIFGETDYYINAQCLKILDEGMSVMLCIGESLAEFEADLAGSVCATQLKKGLKGVRKEDLDRVAIAYEPVWAIGTGEVATPEIAQSVHAKCRDILAGMYDQETANMIRILYGGSVTPDSIDDLMAMPDIDGALVGGASLDIKNFGMNWVKS
ncbi:hypothetical protein ACHAW5_004348 [Stephanodiscus triporus]|uniref:Triosephosphate isomerase n=1 Tax=Stephanodiscus triporus TaxID=2934178 RepID=A0ABD3Q5H7_9STRA